MLASKSGIFQGHDIASLCFIPYIYGVLPVMIRYPGTTGKHQAQEGRLFQGGEQERGVTKINLAVVLVTNTLM
jgi:hypothetical protein